MGSANDSFRIHLTKNIFQCFACDARRHCVGLRGRHGAVFDPGSGSPAAAMVWDSRIGAAAVSSRGGWAEGELVRKEEATNLPLRFALTGVEINHPYLVQRGIDPATATEFGVGLYPRPGLMRGRIVIPIRNVHGQLVAYAGRALDDRPPRYKLPAGFRKVLELFNLQRAVAVATKTVIVVEGYFDCMRVHQAGFPWVVALMGSSLSAAQESALLQHFEQIVLMMDGDAAGRAASAAIATRLSGRHSFQVIRVPDGRQPDQLSSTTIRQLLQQLLAQTKGPW